MIRQDKINLLKQIVEEFKTLNYKEVENSKFLTSKKYEFTLNNGKIITREKLLKNGKDGSASIIIPVMNNEILTIIEPRVFTKLTVGVGFPAGYIEENENPIEAAKRELLEETGYQVENLIELDSFYQDEGCSSSLNHIFLANNIIKVGNQNLDKDEYIKYMFLNFDEILYLEETGYIKGVNSKLAIEKVKKYMKEI